MNRLTTQQPESSKITKHKEVLFSPIIFPWWIFCALFHECAEVHLDHQIDAIK